MFFENDQLTARLRSILDEGKRYFYLEKRYLGLQLVEALTTLLAAIALWAIIILIGACALLFGGIALSVWLGSLLGSTLLGFLIVAVAQVLLVALVYTQRKKWLVEPTARFLIKIFLQEVTSQADDKAKEELP